MPFIAKDKNTGKRVCILDYEYPRSHLKRDTLVCPFCDQSLIIHAGRLVIRHFAHRAACTSTLNRQPESPEHLAAKKFMFEKLRSIFAEYTKCEVRLEVAMPEINRIADIAIIFPMGWQEVHEIQLSSITIEELEARTNDYLRAGCDVLWWLGKNADTPANRAWCANNIGGFGRISFRDPVYVAL